MINQQVIKAVNKKKIYMLISENPGISRVNLAARTELSKTTVSALVDELIQEGRIVDEGAVAVSYTHLVGGHTVGTGPVKSSHGIYGLFCLKYGADRILLLGTDSWDSPGLAAVW